MASAGNFQSYEVSLVWMGRQDLATRETKATLLSFLHADWPSIFFPVKQLDTLRTSYAFKYRHSETWTAISSKAGGRHMPTQPADSPVVMSRAEAAASFPIILTCTVSPRWYFTQSGINFIFVCASRNSNSRNFRSWLNERTYTKHSQNILLVQHLLSWDTKIKYPINKKKKNAFNLKTVHSTWSWK